ncbi:hypothetical protein PIB30_006222 [Stylosanthes scabra]|uniref:Uncharacterized protein n=1 Tax=Stylosanthes scabra TaxID=79078 RepID=A0ABU6Z0X6_9FABA|nr:hypothetical protein [Stylosanthes scabra]
MTPTPTFTYAADTHTVTTASSSSSSPSPAIAIRHNDVFFSHPRSHHRLSFFFFLAFSRHRHPPPRRLLQYQEHALDLSAKRQSRPSSPLLPLMRLGLGGGSGYCVSVQCNGGGGGAGECFINGLELFIHRKILFDDPKTLWNAFCLAKFYEARWMNPFSEISKSELSSQIQIQIQRSSSTKIPEVATILDSKLHKTNREQRDTVSDLQPQQEEDSSEIQHSQIRRIQLQSLIRNSNYNSSHPEIQSKLQSPGTTTSRIHNLQDEALNTAFQATSESKVKFSATNLEVPDRAFNDGRPILVRSGAGAAAKGKVDTDVATSSTARTREPVQVEADIDSIVTQTWWCFESIRNTRTKKASIVHSREVDDAEEQNYGGCAGDVADGAPRRAEVGASVKGNRETWTAEDRVALRRFFLLNLPPLLAAIFPWDRDEVRTVAKKEGMALPGAGAIGRGSVGGEPGLAATAGELTVAAMELGDSTAQWRKGRCSLSNPRVVYMICERWMLTPIFELGFLSFQWIGQAQSEIIIKGDKPIY